MAGIDKTYTNSYDNYREFKDWSKTQEVTFFNGHKERISNWIYEYSENDFDGDEIPIMNTPTWLDIYLIQNCKIQFVLDRMQAVYGKESYDNFKTINLSACPSDDYKQNRKIVIKKNNRTKFPLHSKPYGGKMQWWLQSDNEFWYDDKTKTWSNSDMHYPYNTNTAHLSSIKSLIKHLRKQYLPKGAQFRISGRYVGEDYSVYIR